MDFLIKNGQVYDPETHQLIRKNMALVNGKIEYPGEGRDESGYRQVIDARDCLVTPGLIDYHTHYFFRGSENGVNGDAASFCMGITTAVDGGTVPGQRDGHVIGADPELPPGGFGRAVQ